MSSNRLSSQFTAHFPGPFLGCWPLLLFSATPIFTAQLDKDEDVDQTHPVKGQNWEDPNGRGEESLLLTRKCQASSQQVEEAAQQLWEGPAEEATCLVDSVSVQAWHERGDLRVEASALLCCPRQISEHTEEVFLPDDCSLLLKLSLEWMQLYETRGVVREETRGGEPVGPETGADKPAGIISRQRSKVKILAGLCGGSNNKQT